MRTRHLLPLVFTLAAATSCEPGPNPLAGSFTATSFIITDEGSPPIDVLALGGSLTIAIAENNSTSGSLVMPAALTGGAAATVSMAGTASRNGTTVTFDQGGDSFVRDLQWTFSGNTLNVNHTDFGVTLDITMTRLP